MVIGLGSVGLEMFKLSQKLFIGYNKSGSVKKHPAIFLLDYFFSLDSRWHRSRSARKNIKKKRPKTSKKLS